MKHRSLIKCNILCRYDLASGRETYRDSNVSSVAFNSVFAPPFHTLQLLQPLLCFNASSPAVTRTCCATAGKTPCPFARQTSNPTGGRFSLSLKTANVLQTCCREKLVGFVVGVKGSKVFCLQMDSMKTFDVRCNHHHVCMPMIPSSSSTRHHAAPTTQTEPTVRTDNDFTPSGPPKCFDAQIHPEERFGRR
jgi:hypothetical protein